MVTQTFDGRLIVVAGASRSGKTAYTIQRCASESRMLVWDVEDQWSALRGVKRISTQRDLLHACTQDGPARLAYVPSPARDLKTEFDYWAGCALHAGRYHGGMTVVAEELADVTNQAKAPGNWGILLRRGLKRQINIFAISQRWAEADKTAVGNATEFVLFRMSSGDDMAYMARKTRVPITELEALKPLDYVRYAVTGEI